LFHRYAPHLTFNKIEAFTSNSGKEHIVGLTSTRQEEEFRNLIEGLRNEATNLGAHLEDYRLHVTLARVPVNVISLQELEKIIANIPLREFTLALTNIDYNYRTKNPKERVIEKWILEKANKRFK
jgi:2'-5' RNA ligase